MKIIQITESLAYGDGSSNCIFSISEILDELNYPNIIMAYRIDELIKDKHIVKGDIYEPIEAEEDDIIIYHLYVGNSANYIIEKLPLKKILVYHNVTTPDFFRGINEEELKSCLWGHFDASKTVGKYLKSIVLSEFSKRNLVDMGWKTEDISVIPLIKTNHSHIRINQEIADRYSDDYINFLSVGRIAPNKKIEDVIRIFSYYQTHINCKSRLMLVGSIGYQNYYEGLIQYIKLLNVDNVIFTGRVANEDLEAYYTVSDIYLCMSEHEGFCIPLIEAMKREIPIVAYSSTAVPDTLGEAGILLDCKDEKKAAQHIVQLLCDATYRREIIGLQNKRVKALSLENYKVDLKKIIEEVRQIEKFSYLPESKEKLICPIISKPEKKTDSQYLEDLEGLFQDKENVVVYGIGKAGKKLLAVCEKYSGELLRKVVICDNSFKEKYYEQIPVIKHNECIKTYTDALYIITVQNACVDIISSLISSNIDKRNIKFYNLSANKIV